MLNDKHSQLSTACNQYLKHLAERIKSNLKSDEAVDFPLITNNAAIKRLRQENKILKLACLKYEAVYSLKESSHNEVEFSTKLTKSAMKI